MHFIPIVVIFTMAVIRQAEAADHNNAKEKTAHTAMLFLFAAYLSAHLPL